MQAILAMLVRTLLSFGADWLQAWYQREQAEANAWAAKTREGQLASAKRAEVVADQVAAAARQRTAVVNPAEWNAGAAPVLLVACLLLSGCFTRTVFVPAKMPLLPAPARPVVPTEPATWTDRERILAAYATSLEAAVIRYNQLAQEQNAANGY